jgi:hypothetical protein
MYVGFASWDHVDMDVIHKVSLRLRWHWRHAHAHTNSELTHAAVFWCVGDCRACSVFVGVYPCLINECIGLVAAQQLVDITAGRGAAVVSSNRISSSGEQRQADDTRVQVKMLTWRVEEKTARQWGIVQT